MLDYVCGRQVDSEITGYQAGGLTGKLSRRAAIGSAAIDPVDVAAVSVHGTGTPLGDPIEVGALGQCLGSGGGGSRKQQRGHGSNPGGRPLMLLSNKACYGHTEGTAGISGTSNADCFSCSSSRDPVHFVICQIKKQREHP